MHGLQQGRPSDLEAPQIAHRLGRYVAKMKGHGDLVNRLIMGIIGVFIWLLGVIHLLTKPT